MAIAKNFLKFPQAMAMQWPLPLGKARAWETPRPKKYQGYGFRTLLSRAAKIASRRAKKALEALPFAEKLERAGAVKKPAPQWWKDVKRRAQELAKKIKDSCMNLEFCQIKKLDQEDKKSSELAKKSSELAGLARCWAWCRCCARRAAPPGQAACRERR